MPLPACRPAGALPPSLLHGRGGLDGDGHELGPRLAAEPPEQHPDRDEEEHRDELREQVLVSLGVRPVDGGEAAAEPGVTDTGGDELHGGDRYQDHQDDGQNPVSYTHLTLPTIYSV